MWASVIGLLTSTAPGALAGNVRSPCPQPIFGSAVHAVPAAATGFATGDVDGDGQIDLVVISAWATGGHVHLHRNVAGRALADGEHVLTCPNAKGAVLQDLNGDGLDDLVLVCPNSSSISVMMSLGSDFAEPNPYFVGHMPESVAAGDLDGDGHVDLAAVSGSDESIVFIRNLGNGYFMPKAPIPAGAAPTSVRIADVDGDGDPDVLCGHATAGTSHASLWRNDGLGNLAPPLDVLLGPSPVSLQLGDLDGDGRLDLVAASPASGQVCTAIQNASGGFDAPSAWTVGGSPTDIRIGDIDGDRDLDIVAASESAELVAASFNDGSAHFGTGTPLTSTSKGRAVELLDVDVDGQLDVVHSLDNQWIEILLGDGGGMLGAIALELPEATDDGNVGVGVADVDLDGDLDIVVARSESVLIVAYNDRGAFIRSAVIDYSTAWPPTSLTIADLDADGAEDAVVTNDHGASVFYGDHSGGFAAPASFGVWHSGSVKRCHAVDLDGDGDLDLVLPQSFSYATSLMRRLPSGAFQSAATIQSTIGSVRAVAPVDLDGDGDADLAVASNTDMETFMNAGGFVFERGQTFKGIVSGTIIRDLAAIDADLDGDLDVAFVAAPTDGEGVFGLAWNEGGQLVGTSSYPESGGSSRVRFDDLDGDGVRDAIIGRGEPSTDAYSVRVAVRVGGGDGSFGPAVQYARLGSGPASIAVGDINGDGAADLVLSSHDGGPQPALLLSRCGSCPGDVDGDGLVGAADLGLILAAWGGPLGDLNADSVTNEADLAILLGNWGSCPELCSEC